MAIEKDSLKSKIKEVQTNTSKKRRKKTSIIGLQSYEV
jgi:hypothetical protein